MDHTKDAKDTKDTKDKGTKGTKGTKDAKDAKGKTKKKAAKAAVASPDEPLDDDAEAGAEAAAQPVPVRAKAPTVQAVWKQHPSLRFGKVLRLDFQAKFQEDYRSSYPGAEVTAELAQARFHRSRVGVAGTLFKHIEFEVERELKEKELSEKDRELGLTPSPQWKDVNVNVDYLNNAQIQVGKFKIPFGLDTMTGVSHNDFIYRSLGAIYLTPSRDIGAMVHGRFFKRGLNYWTGVFRHDGDNARSKKIDGGNGTFAARVTGNPFKKLGGFDAVTVGTAYAFTKVSDSSNNPNGLRGRTVLTQDTFFEAVYVKGHRNRWEADVDFTKGPASIRTEYTYATDQRLQQGINGSDLPDVRGQAWYVSGTWVLTGEPKTRPVKPANEFLRGGLGSIEVATRFERLWFDSVGSSSDPALRNPRAENILASGEKALTIGVNWTLNRWVKMQFTAIRETIEDPGRSPVTSNAFWSRVARFQFLL